MAMLEYLLKSSEESIFLIKFLYVRNKFNS
jgi:hypothetical protein